MVEADLEAGLAPPPAQRVSPFAAGCGPAAGAEETRRHSGSGANRAPGKVVPCLGQHLLQVRVARCPPGCACILRAA